MTASQNSLGPKAGVPQTLPAFLQASEPDVPPPPRKDRRPVPGYAIDLLIAAGLAAATFLLYLPALSNNFIEFDDPRYVTSNPVVKQGMSLHAIRWAFTTDSAANWLPMVWLTHLATVSLFGLDPKWHHAVNTILHAFNAALVFIVLRSMTGRRWCAVLVAALWAFHPLRVESVAWVTERKDVLAGFFFMLTLLAYWHYVRRPSWLRYGQVLALFALALMSKTVVVTVPFLLLLLDVWPLNRGRWTMRTLAEKIPLLLLSAIASVWTVVLQHNGNEMKAQQFWSLGQRAANADVSVARYLMKTYWPTGLSAFYPHPGSWPAGVVIASSALIVGVTLLAWQLRKSMPYVIVGWLWFLGMLVPVSGLVQAGFQSMADRHTYLPSIGLFIMLVWAGASVVSDRPLAMKLSTTFTVAVLAALAAVSWTRQKVWGTTFELFNDALAVDEQNWRAHDLVGGEWVKKGDNDAAMWHFQRSAELNPRNPFSFVYMGTVLRREGRISHAVAMFRTGVALAPEVALCHQWLGLGLAMQGDYAGADRELAEATRLAPEDPAIPGVWALTMVARGRLDRAKELAQTALDLDPTDPKAVAAMEKIDHLIYQRRAPATKP